MGRVGGVASIAIGEPIKSEFRRLPAGHVPERAEPYRPFWRRLHAARNLAALATLACLGAAAVAWRIWRDRLQTRPEALRRSRSHSGAALSCGGRACGQFRECRPSHRHKTGGGGERGIRTLDRLSPIHAFQACAFNHSATSPRPGSGGIHRWGPLSQARVPCRDKANRNIPDA